MGVMLQFEPWQMKTQGFPGGLVVKNPPAKAQDTN